jgi:hypothetical protein
MNGAARRTDGAQEGDVDRKKGGPAGYIGLALRVAGVTPALSCYKECGSGCVDSRVGLPPFGRWASASRPMSGPAMRSCAPVGTVAGCVVFSAREGYLNLLAAVLAVETVLSYCDGCDSAVVIAVRAYDGYIHIGVPVLSNVQCTIRVPLASGHLVVPEGLLNSLDG